jgi:hypothetical protein
VSVIHSSNGVVAIVVVNAVVKSLAQFHSIIAAAIEVIAIAVIIAVVV